jgi:hypothetical protein
MQGQDQHYRLVRSPNFQTFSFYVSDLEAIVRATSDGWYSKLKGVPRMQRPRQGWPMHASELLAST